LKSAVNLRFVVPETVGFKECVALRVFDE
jgi:hypothetical protein